jgi:hypothetical protein
MIKTPDKWRFRGVCFAYFFISKESDLSYFLDNVSKNTEKFTSPALVRKNAIIVILYNPALGLWT